MGNNAEEYRIQLSPYRDKILFLLRNSGLPVKGANIELAIAFAETAGRYLIYNRARIFDGEFSITAQAIPSVAQPAKTLDWVVS